MIETHAGTIEEDEDDVSEQDQKSTLVKLLFKEVKSLKEVPNSAKTEVSSHCRRLL